MRTSGGIKIDVPLYANKVLAITPETAVVVELVDASRQIIQYLPAAPPVYSALKEEGKQP